MSEENEFLIDVADTANNNINKDKIRAKIKSYKSYEHLEMFEKFNYGEIIQVLEELLEEE